MTEFLDTALRAEIASLRDQVIALGRQLEAARTRGTPEEVYRLRPLFAEASERYRDAWWIPGVLEAATALHYRQGEGWLGLDTCGDALDRLLRHHGGDGVGELEVVEASSARVTLVGGAFWLSDIPAGCLVEASFTFDRDPRAITRMVVRGREVGDVRYEGAWDDWSARDRAECIANRPERDEQWAVVIRAPSS